MRHILCYGDSNTWGTIGLWEESTLPTDRFDRNHRWTGVLQTALGDGFEVIEEGLGGRTTIYEKPGEAWKNGEPYLIPCLHTHRPVDLIVIMLGTNDLLQFRTPQAACKKMERFLKSLTLDRDKILLIAPMPMKIGEWVQDQKLTDDSITLAKNYKVLAERLGVRFADAGEWNIPIAYDGVHLTEEGHRAFAQRLIEYLHKGE